MVSVSSDDAQFSALLSLNTQMQALWLCAHVDQTSFPNILKDKRTDLKKSALKNQRGPAAAELMKEIIVAHRLCSSVRLFENSPPYFVSCW